MSRLVRDTAGPLGDGTSVPRRDDVTDLLVGAIHRVKLLTTIEKLSELGLKSDQFALLRLDVTQFPRQQRLHVGTRESALAAQIENADDLDRRESRSLPAADERKPFQERGVVLSRIKV